MADLREYPRERFYYRVNPHYTGIDLETKVTGLKYRAWAPDLDIRPERQSITGRFKVYFRGNTGKYKGLGIACLEAGRNLYNVEACIMNAIEHPSILFDARVGSVGNVLRRRPRLVKCGYRQFDL